MIIQEVIQYIKDILDLNAFLILPEEYEMKATMGCIVVNQDYICKRDVDSDKIFHPIDLYLSDGKFYMEAMTSCGIPV